jgi:phosphoglycolate phosphatase
VTPRLVVFDLDGTLVDSKRDLADAANALLAELGGRRLTEDQIAAMVGEGAALLVGRALRGSGVDADLHAALARFLELYDERLLAHTVLYDDMADALTTLAPRAMLSVLTNKPTRATERILSGLGIRERFRDVLGGDSRFGRKPDPAGLQELMARAGTAPDSTWLVGDSRIDMLTARNAGTHIVLARYGFGFRFDPSDFDGRETFIDSPSQLLAVVDGS